MKLIDYLLDDRQKRTWFLLALISGIMIHELFYSYLLGCQLAKCSDTTSMFALANYADIEKCFIGRLIVNYLQYGQGSGSLWLVLIRSIRWDGIAYIILLVFMAWREEYEPYFKRMLSWIFCQLVFFGGEILWMLYQIYKALSSLSSALVAQHLTSCGNGVRLICLTGMLIIMVVLAVEAFMTYSKGEEENAGKY